MERIDMKRMGLGVAALAVLTAGVLACQPPAGGDDIQAIKDGQAQILEKLAKVEADLEEIKKAPRAAAARPQRPTEDFDKAYDIALGTAPLLGNPDAPVTIVEFSDFQCPFCTRANPLLKEVLAKYPDKVKLAFKHFPLSFHQAARPAAIASQAAAEQGKFWEMHDVLFANQRTLDAAKIEEYAASVEGLDVARFKADLEKNKDAYGKIVDSDFRQGTSIDVRGTPTLYIGGKKVRVRSVEGMSQMIDEALKAKAS